MPGPLSGLRVLEIAGIGPGPFCCMMLADLGAEVLRIDRPERRAGQPGRCPRTRAPQPLSWTSRSPPAIAAVLRLVERADVLVEGFRPGRDGTARAWGRTACQARNPRLVYGRMTGWGQDGPLAQAAGHDITYIALDRRAVVDGPRRRTAGAAAEPGGRFRRRRHAAGLWHHGRPVRGATAPAAARWWMRR